MSDRGNYETTLAAMGVCVAARIPFLLWGQPGAGKTAVIESATRLGWRRHLDPGAGQVAPGEVFTQERCCRGQSVHRCRDVSGCGPIAAGHRIEGIEGVVSIRAIRLAPRAFAQQPLADAVLGANESLVAYRRRYRSEVDFHAVLERPDWFETLASMTPRS